MSSKKQQQPIKEPPVTDPHNVQTIFANGLSTIELGGGSCVISFVERKMLEGREDAPPKFERNLVARIALPGATLDELMNKLIGMNRAVQQHNALAEAPAPEEVN